MRRRLVSQCLVVFVIFYLIGGIYFYVLSSGGNEVRLEHDYEEHYNNLRDVVKSEKESNFQKTKNVVIEFNEDFDKMKSKTGDNKQKEENERVKNIVIGEVKSRDVFVELPSTKSRHPKRLIDNARKQVAKHKTPKPHDEVGTKIEKSETESKSSMQNDSAPKAIYNKYREQKKISQKDMNRLIEDKAREYIRRKFLNANWAKKTEVTLDLRDKSKDFESKESNITLSLENILPRNLTENSDAGHDYQLNSFASSSLPTENVNFQQAFPDVYIYSAYIDDRKEERFVRVVLVARSYKNVKPLWCHFRSANSPSVAVHISELTFYETCENHVKEHAAYIGSCQIPHMGYDTEFITLSNNPIAGTGISFSMSTIQNKFKYGFRHKFTTCVPPLFGNVTVLRLVEFIEFSRILGVEHFVFYYNKFNIEVGHLLNYYVHLGIATVLPWNMKMTKQQLWYHGQSAAVWDCLFRTMFISEWVSFNDIDEYLIPQKHKTWIDMFDDIKNSHAEIKPQNVAVYRFYSAFFDSAFKKFRPNKFTESSQFLTMNITTRTSQLSKIRTKMIVYPPRVFEIGIHHLSKPMEEHFQCVTVDSSFAILNHYRSCDWNYGMNCENVIYDNKTHNYHDALLKNVKNNLIRAKKSYSTNKMII